MIAIPTPSHPFEGLRNQLSIQTKLTTPRLEI